VKAPIGTGELTQFEQTGFRGSGDVDAGRLGDDPCAYVATVEPFHGNTVAVYTKQSDGPADKVVWKRYLLDVFGDPNENGEGPGHCVSRLAGETPRVKGHHLRCPSARTTR
jgi:hypothetical protein